MKASRISRRTAFSLAELVVTIAVIGVIAAIAIPVYSHVMDNSRKAAVQDHIEQLNRAVADFSHACWKISTPPDSGSADEFVVLRSLQYAFPKWPDPRAKMGSPYFNPKYDPISSSETSVYRIRWNGRSFEMIDRNQPGTGLRFDAINDVKATPYTFPSGYKPAGA